MLSSSNFQLSLFLMSTRSYLKFRTIRGTPQKWVGSGKPLLIIHCFAIHITQTCLCDETFKSSHQITFTRGVVLYSHSYVRCSPHTPDHSKATWLNFVPEIVQLKLWVYHFPRNISNSVGTICPQEVMIG